MAWPGGVRKLSTEDLGGSKLAPYDQLDRLWHYEYPLLGPWLCVAEGLHESSAVLRRRSSGKS